MNRWDQAAHRTAERAKPTAEVSQADVDALEAAGDALMRAHAIDNALAMYALALRLRAALGVAHV